MKWLAKYGLFFLPVTLLLVCRAALDFNGLFGQDSHECVRFTRSIAEMLFHAEGLQNSWWPTNYPFLSSLLSRITGDAMLAMQLISTLAFTGFLWNIHQLLNEAWPKRDHRLFLFGLVALSPYLLRSSVVTMTDAMALFFVAGAILHFARSMRYSTVMSMAWFALFSGLAITTNYSLFILLLPFGISTIGNALRRWQYMHIAIAFCLFFVAWLPEWSIKGTDLAYSFGSEYFTSWRPLNWFLSQFAHQDELNNYLLPNIVFAFNSLVHPGFWVIGIALVAFFRKADWEVPLVQVCAIAFVLYSLFVAGIPYQNNRAMLVSFPLLLVALNPAFFRLRTWLDRAPAVNKAFPAALVLVQLCLCCIPLYRVWDYNQTEREIAEYFRQHYNAETLYSFGIDRAFDSYEVPVNLVKISAVKPQQLEAKALAIISPDMHLSPTQHEDVFENWLDLTEHRERELVHEFRNGWQLLRLK